MPRDAHRSGTIMGEICMRFPQSVGADEANKLRTRHAPIRGIALASLGVIAVAYSVTCELALMSASRGDLAAERLKASETGNIARDRYTNAKTELARMAQSRTVLELETLIGT